MALKLFIWHDLIIVYFNLSFIRIIPLFRLTKTRIMALSCVLCVYWQNTSEENFSRRARVCHSLPYFLPFACCPRSHQDFSIPVQWAKATRRCPTHNMKHTRVSCYRIPHIRFASYVYEKAEIMDVTIFAFITCINGMAAETNSNTSSNSSTGNNRTIWLHSANGTVEKSMDGYRVFPPLFALRFSVSICSCTSHCLAGILCKSWLYVYNV